MIFDFHTHTVLSDGVLSPMELIGRAVKRGYKAIAITDHAGVGQLERFVSEVTRDCALAEKYWPIKAVPGVELTHLPPEAISDAARQAKEMGARWVVVHGETLVEPVPKGTNLAAVQSPHVDLLAHPGLLTCEEAMLAAERGIFLEISARKGHSLTNGHVARVAQIAGAKLLLGSDAHDVGDLLSDGQPALILQGAGLTEDQIKVALEDYPAEALTKIGK